MPYFTWLIHELIKFSSFELLHLNLCGYIRVGKLVILYLCGYIRAFLEGGINLITSLHRRL